MKKLLLLLSLSIACASGSHAQLADGTTVPDFSFTDINGNSHTLYSYLDQGKYVAIDVSATWCSPCWDYHNSHVLDSLYEKYDQPGTQEWKLLFVEGDGSTNNADLHGTGLNTKGDWVAGSNYTIIDPPSDSSLSAFLTGYQVNFFPTFYLICPNKKVYQQALNGSSLPTVADWEATKAQCQTSSVTAMERQHSFRVFPNPAKARAHITLKLKQQESVKLELSSLTGSIVRSKDYGRIAAGEQSLVLELEDIAPGSYLLYMMVGDTFTVQKLMVY